PKGVMIEHRALLDHCFGLVQAADLQNCKSFALFSPLVFDAGHAIIHTSFILGASLHVLSSHLLANGENLLYYFESETIDCLKIVPSLWLTYAAEAQVILAKKVMIFGGESFPVKLKSYLSGYAGAVFNHYGPTEATIGKTIHRVNLNLEYGQIPIGRPFSNTSVYIVNNQHNILPIGEIGELVVGGEGLARGYLKLPELTNQKFVPHLFSRLPGARLYRTGDLAKWLPSGEIEYLGRRDDQVKIRGHRIEIGEIESVIQQSKFVVQNAVLAITAENGVTRLVAIFVPAKGFSQVALEFYLRERLPAYMLPTQWVEVTRMPLTVNGKLDRKKLAEMSIAASAETSYAAPTSPTETVLSEIWQRLLGLVRIGTKENFWELGGHSLLAMRLVSAVRKQLHIELDLKQLFQYKTIEELANYLETQVPDSSLELVLPAEEILKPVLSFGQQSLWFIHQSEGSKQYHLPFAWNLTGNVNKNVLEIAFQYLIERHLPLKTVFHEEEGIGFPEVLTAENWRLSELDWSQDQHANEDVAVRLRALIRKPFNLSADFMLRAHLIQSSVTEHILLVTIHHIASDGWSTTILVRELSELYNDLQLNREANLPLTGINYQDFARWQQNQVKSPSWQTKLDYWARQLEAVPNLQLPIEHNSKLRVDSEGDTVTYDIGQELTGQLHALSQQQGATLFMTLLAAFNVLLYRYNSQENFCVGTPTAGRQQEELEELVGYFVNTLALRASLNRSLSFEELLTQVKITTLDAYQHQDIPFEKVVQLVVPEREDGVSPLFQVMLVLQNTPQLDKLKLDGLQVRQDISPSSLHTRAQFPLTFVFTQSAKGLELVVEYQSALFTGATIHRMAANYARLLQGIVADPTQLIGSLPLVSKQEEFRLLHEFNRSTPGAVAGSTVLDLFNSQVQAHPTKAAVVFGTAELSYKQLDERSNQLANFLAKQGLKDQLVPICIERSFDMLVGILAILKAGAAYVPVDPTYSPERIAYILQDCAAPALLASGNTRPILPPGGKAKIISIDTDWPVISLESTDLNESRAIDPESLAYVIYTSGSTGKPKGTMLQHKSLFASVQTRINHYGPIGKVFLVPSVAFDSSVGVIFGTLATGDTLVLCRDEDVKEPAVLS
ncbi:MAG: condensation domain-containing protein, partial [Bacteroidota bacterium]